MTTEFEDILVRFKDVDCALRELVAEDFGKYQKLLTEYSILKPIAEKLVEINNNKEEINNLNEMLKIEQDINEKSNYILWIEELNSNNLKLEKQLQLVLNSRKQNKKSIRKILLEEIDSQTNLSITKSTKRSKKNFDDAIKRIKKRYWEVIAPNWINSIPAVFEPGAKPEIEIHELPGFSQIAKEIVIDEDTALESDNISIVFEKKINRIIRELFFRKGLFLFHKASHITSAAQIHATKGLQSWALTSAYQGAFLGAKSILYLMGIGVGNSNNNTFLIDVWKDSRHEPDENNEVTCGLIRFSYKIEHRHTWQLFKRVISSFEVNVWNKKFIAALKKIEIENFSAQRNSLNYWGNNWIFEDLHEFLIDKDFGVRIDGLEGGVESFNEKSDFTMIVSLMILSLAYDLINDLSQQTNLLNGEKELITNFLKEEQRHPLYQKNFTIA